MASFALALALGTVPVSAQPAPMTRDRIEDCVLRAARHHGVNPSVLRAILRVESNLDPGAVGRNADGTVDLGIGQINSRHFAKLARHGIRPAHLMDGCVGAYVAAWHLSTLIATHGNTWEAIARYHSATPALNRRYQLLLGNELVAAGALPGARRLVPPATQAPARPPEDAEASWPPAMVFDDPGLSPFASTPDRVSRSALSTLSTRPGDYRTGP